MFRWIVFGVFLLITLANALTTGRIGAPFWAHWIVAAPLGFATAEAFYYAHTSR